MQVAKQRKRVIFRSVRSTTERDQETGERVKRFSPLEYLPSSYVAYDEATGHPKQVVYSLVSETIAGKVVPRPEEIKLVNGHLEIKPGQEFLESFLNNHPNLDTEKNRQNGRKILFERVDMVKEKVNEVSGADAIVKAFNLITSSKPKDLVTYGKSLGVDTSDVEGVSKEGIKEKDLEKILKSPEWEIFIIDMKNHANASPELFAKGLGNPLNEPLAVIAEATEHGVIGFDSNGSQYGWKAGNDLMPIKQLPHGVDKEAWFAQWLTENPETLKEIQNRVALSKNATK